MATRTVSRSRPWILDRPIRAIVRSLAFTGKELHEVIRQPRLLLGLVVGPFLILLAFGSGFKGQLVEQPTALVIPADSGLSTKTEDYKDAFQFPFTLAAVVTTMEEAQRLFDEKKASVIVALPSDTYQRIRAGEHPLIDMRYNELEPVRANYLKFYSYVQTNELNRRVLIAVVNQAKSQNEQTSGPPLQGYTGKVQAGVDQYTQRVRGKDAAGATAALGALLTETANSQSDIRTRVQLLNGVAGYFNAPAGGQTGPTDQQAAAVDQSLTNVQTVLKNLQTTLPQQVSAGQPDTRATGDAVTNARNAEDGAKTLQLPPAEVLVAPFQAEVTNEARVLPNFITYYAPAVLALLLQHVSISLTALTLVRERTSGATELFRISPSAAPEIVFGKFLGYATVATVAGAILAALLRFALKVPMFGSWYQFAAVLALLIAASLGFGLVISALARSESQAVQYGMLILLASVFFGNFFLAIDTLYPWARVISYALPITYGVRALQDIMLRGKSVNLVDIGALAAFAIGLFILGTLLFRREVRRA